VRFSGPRAVEAPTAEKVRDRLTSWMEHGSPKPDPHWIPIRRSRRPIVEPDETAHGTRSTGL
jgi:hypothetical protein